MRRPAEELWVEQADAPRLSRLPEHHEHYDGDHDDGVYDEEDDDNDDDEFSLFELMLWTNKLDELGAQPKL